MSEKIDRLRSWLERNKIFFDITTAFLLALMTITVSISANTIAKNQNDLMKEESQPIFRFNLTEDNEGKNNTSGAVETLRIYNDGKPIYKFSAETYDFLNINFYDKDSDDMPRIKKIVYLPVFNFYEWPTCTSYSTGLLATLSRSDPNSEAREINEGERPVALPNEDIYNCSDRNTLIDSNTSTILNYISDNFSSYLEKKSNYEESGSVDLHIYVYITYTDIYNEEHDEFFLVNKWGAGKLSEKDKILLEKMLSKEKFTRYLSQQNSIYFSYIPPKRIIELLSESTAEDRILPGPSWQAPYEF